MASFLVTDELAAVGFSDARRTRRLIAIVEDLAAKPNASVAQARRDRSAMQEMYDSCVNRRVKAAAIIRAHAAKRVDRMAGESTLLAIQDTTELDYMVKRLTVQKTLANATPSE
ncbi:hypothetical protein H6F67_15560 [Microcoleus sp. FACHB-1515]|uniref:transposase DNA-binding-containing protein n=1 Tax=Cyanophyceae TaxID=3028117 RepID=UPI0016848987|nr:transposase DNA-binding-containing protein [Microcoleus sp. FACHB-1515]MBD2091272.1 hypothetical protein [Microcoleus sp. FACHB-1515]